jgi:hypothetical protein
MPELTGRALIDSRFGPLGCGQGVITIDGSSHDVADLLFRMGLNFDDCKPIDVQAVNSSHYVVRYFDGQDSRVVAYEFDSGFRFIAETRAHIAEWLGEDAYFSFYAGH